MEGINFERAIELLTANAKEISDAEEISLIKAVGRVAARNYFATFDNPPFDKGCRASGGEKLFRDFR